MIKIKKFVFNPFQVNTFVLSDDSRECVIIDPGCSDGVESLELKNYLESEGLKPVRLLLTHTHIDHIVGCSAVEEMTGLGAEAHAGGIVFLEHATRTAETYGISLDKNPQLRAYLEDGDEISFGKSKLEVLYTPGHAEGSVCYLSREDGFVIVGDVLFYTSIGRTDFPTGNYEILRKSIFEKLFILPDDTMVYPGHGPETNIGFEKVNNPFLGNDQIMY